MDPGRVNFAYALREYGAITDVGWVTPLENVTEDTAFINSFIELVVRTSPDFVVLERFMVRGGGQSRLAETLNQMIGRIVILTRMYAGVELIQITAAQWKNWWNKGIEEDWHEAYSEVGSIHQRDACGISEYIQNYWLEKNL